MSLDEDCFEQLLDSMDDEQKVLYYGRLETWPPKTFSDLAEELGLNTPSEALKRFHNRVLRPVENCRKN